MTNSEIFIGAISSAYHKLAAKRTYLDETNVFPVADRDTGTNLCRTVKAGADAVKKSTNLSVAQLLEKASKAMLRNARGNSGVIISALFKGFSDHMNKVGSFSAAELSNAFDSALKNACKVLSRPIFKGTVLSVVIACRDALLKNKFESTREAFAFLAPVAKAALEKTAEDLPQAKENGSVDSGAAGLFFIIEAVDCFLSKRQSAEALSPEEEDEMARKNLIFKKLPSKERPEYTYCTEFLIFKKERVSSDELEKKLLPLGDCVIVASDDEVIKVHLHTNDPGKAMTVSAPYGVLTDIKIDNMALQTER